MKNSICMVMRNQYIAILSKGFLSAMFTTLYSISLANPTPPPPPPSLLSTYAHTVRPVTINIRFKRVCFYCVLCITTFYHENILNIFAVRMNSMTSHTVDMKRTVRPLQRSRAEGFSITDEESISYLRNDYDPLEIISFDRITY